MDQIKNIKSKLMFLLVLFVTVGTMTSSASAATINIADGANLTDIQSAIDGAGIGDIISFAENGVYNILGSINITKSLTILGNGATITGIQNANTYIFNLAVNSSTPQNYKDISISNLTLNAMSTINVGSGASNITLDNLTLEGASVNNGTGINTRGVNGLTINNVIATNFRDAIGVGGGNNTVVNNSYFYGLGRNAMSFFQDAGNIKVINNNLTNAQFGVFFGGGVKNIEISDNNITNMSNIALALIKAAQSAIISNNNISDNNIGIVIKGGDTNHGEPTQVNNITIDNNTIQNNYLMGIYLRNILESLVQKEIGLTNNTFGGNGVGFREDGGWSDSDWNNSIGDSFDIVKNYYNQTTPDQNPVLSIANSINTHTVTNGAKLIYTITVKNTGNGTSDKIIVNNGILSNIAKYTTLYKSIGTISNNQWTINSLAAGDTASLVLELTTKKSGTQNIVSTLETSTQNNTKSNSQKLTVNKNIKISSQNSLSANKVKRNKYVIITTKISNSGLDNSAKFTSKIATTKGLKLVAISKSSAASYNKNKKTWTIKSVPTKKTLTLKMKFRATKTGTQAIKVTTNGKSQKKSVKVVR